MWTCGSHSSQDGRYQLRLPRSFMVAGTRTVRTMVASSATATAKPEAHLLQPDKWTGGEPGEDRDHDGRRPGD